MILNEHSRRGHSLWRKASLLAAIGTVALAIGARTLQAATPAQTSINNQAIGLYTDGSGLPQSVTSNAVATIVQQVAALSLVEPGDKYATAGSTVVFPHSVTNTGNGTDVFNLTRADLGGDQFDILPQIYADANADGIADSIIPITKTPSLTPGETFHFVVSGVALSTATTGNTALVSVTATSQFDNTTTLTINDKVTITNNALINVVKSIDKSNGAPGSGPYTYTLTYTNSGNRTASNLEITDTLPLGLDIPVGPNGTNGHWSNSGAAVLTDTNGANDDQPGINYSYNSTTRKITAIVASVPAGGSGRLTFQVNIASSALPLPIANTALYKYNDGLAGLLDKPTNTVLLNVSQTLAFTFVGQTVASAPQGGTVLFKNTLTNNGSGTDTFNITYGLGNFPLGTTFQLLQQDQLTPLADSNSDTIPDTGPVVAGGTYEVYLKVTLPPSAILLPGVDYHQIKIATSVKNPLQFNPADDILEDIERATVDLTNDLAGTLGAGPGPGAAAITRLPGAGNSITTFDLYVENTGPVADTYLLLSSATTGFSPSITLPAGFGVTFTNDAGSILTNTGLILPGQKVKVKANVFIPAGTLLKNLDVYFRVISLTTGAFDDKWDAIDIGNLRSITLNTTGSGQVYPGNAVVYTHTLSNPGNLAEGGLLSTVSLATTDSTSGFTSAVHYDANDNGVFDETDPVITNLNSILGGVLPTKSITLFVKVYSPAGAMIGAFNTTTLTATTTGGIGTPPPAATIADGTTIIAGHLKLEKTQALDTNGDGVPDIGYAVTTITTGAKPGTSIRYRVVATNIGTADVTDVKIIDATPAYTTYDTGDNTLSLTGRATWFDGTTYHEATTVPAAGGTLKGKISFEDIGTLAPGKSVTAYFGVKIQ
jgi:uncharacterized repeat protein (TIGR01451 family)